MTEPLYNCSTSVLNCCLIEMEPSKNTFVFLVFACFVLETLLQEEDKRDFREAIYFDSNRNVKNSKLLLFPNVRIFNECEAH